MSPPRLYRQRAMDSLWLAACLGVVQGDHSPVEAFLSSGGDATRQLTAGEVALLNRPSAFDTGYTLVHLAIRYFAIANKEFHFNNILLFVFSARIRTKMACA